MAFVNSIRTYSEKRLIGYTREQLFDVVAAVENYRLFLPACRRSDVLFKSRDRIKAKLEIGIPPLLESYTSNVRLDKPNLITASCIEGHLFKHLETRWRFFKPPRQYSIEESNSIRMDAICNSVVNNSLNDDHEELKISNEIKQKDSYDSSNQVASNLKFKRCKHGRIIVKDSSKKRLSQHDDLNKDTPISITSISSDMQISVNNEEAKKDETQIPPRSNPLEDVFLKQDCEKTKASCITQSSSTNYQSCPLTDIASSSKSSDKICETKKDNPIRATSSKSRIESSQRSPSRRRRSRDQESSSKDQKRNSSISSTRRKSPKQYRTNERSRRSSRKSRSPNRYEGNRAPWQYTTCSRRLPSKRNHSSSSRVRRASPKNHQPSKPLKRNESPLRRRSRSSHSSSMSISRSSSRSPTNHRPLDSAHRHRDNNKSHDKESNNTSGYSATVVHYTKLKRDQDTPCKNSNSLDFQKSTSLSIETVTTNTVLPSSDRETQPSSDNQIKNFHNSSYLTLNQTNPKTAQKEQLHKSIQPRTSPSSPVSTRSSFNTPATEDSPSSEIYDPEGPILPISPVDSPHVSPVNKAANNTIVYRIEGGKNDDDVPSSAVELNHQEKYLQKLNRQERVVEEVKMALKPHYQKRALNKEQYKDVLRRAVPKICHLKNGEINPIKIRKLVDAYVRKMKRSK